MENLLSLLLFAAAFYFMMRFGCGAHMAHGHGGHTGHGRDGAEGHANPKSSTESSDVDPVCGMTVAPGTGYSKVVGAKTYRFCSRRCLDTFEETSHQHAA